MNCPYCNQKLYENGYGDLVCQVDGIIIYHKEEKDDDYNKFKSYIS